MLPCSCRRLWVFSIVLIYIICRPLSSPFPLESENSSSKWIRHRKLKPYNFDTCSSCQRSSGKASKLMIKFAPKVTQYGTGRKCRCSLMSLPFVNFVVDGLENGLQTRSQVSQLLIGCWAEWVKGVLFSSLRYTSDVHYTYTLYIIHVLWVKITCRICQITQQYLCTLCINKQFTIPLLFSKHDTAKPVFVEYSRTSKWFIHTSNTQNN